MKGEYIALLVCVIIMVTVLVWALIATQKKKRIVRDTQRVITDLELLRLFERQTGGLLSSSLVADLTDLTKAEASARLAALHHGGLLSAGHGGNGMATYYELPTALEEIEGLELSDSPFLIVEDLQKIFVAYDYRVSPHDLMVSTGLPWKVLSREMQYFRKQKVVDVVLISRANDSAKQYVLLPPYDKPETLDLKSRTRLNEEVKQVLYDERFLV